MYNYPRPASLCCFYLQYSISLVSSFRLFCSLFPFDLPIWAHADSLAALSGVTSEPQISDPFATEATPASTAATTEIAASTTTTAATAATAAAEVDLFGG